MKPGLFVQVLAAVVALCVAQDDAPPGSPQPSPQVLLGTPVAAPTGVETSRCEIPDLSNRGPLEPGVNADENSYSESLDVIIRDRDNLREYKKWHDQVVGCYQNPEDRVWYLVDWSCLINNLMKPVFDPRLAKANFGTSYRITENDQYYYQCGNTCRYWIKEWYGIGR